MSFFKVSTKFFNELFAIGVIVFITITTLGYKNHSFLLDYRVIITYAIIFIIINYFLIKKIQIINLNVILTLAISQFIFCFFLVFSDYSFNTTRDLELLLDYGSISQDWVFHSSIAENIKSYGFQSTAINGNPFIHYHAGSHYLLAFASYISGYTPLQIFPYQIIFLYPMLVGSILAKQSQECNQGVMFLLSLVLCLLSNFLQTWFWGFDISTPLALLLTFVLLQRFHRNSSILVDALLLFVIAVTKVSVGLFAISIFAIYSLLFEKKGIITFLIKLLIIGASCVVILFFISPTSTNVQLVWDFNSLYKSLKIEEGRDISIASFFAIPLITLAFNLFFKKWDVVIYLIVIILLTYIATNISFINRNHLHFIIAANWISVFYLCSLRFKFLSTNPLFLSLPLATIPMVVYYFLNWNPGINFNQINRISQSLKLTDANLYLSSLSTLRGGEKDFLVYIPESETDFWGHWADGVTYRSSRFFMSFWIPSISGHPAYRGYNPSSMMNEKVAWYPVGAYGFDDYYSYTTPCKGFRYIVELKKVNSKIENSTYECK